MIRRGREELSEGGDEHTRRQIYSGDKTEKLWSQTYIQENTPTIYHCTVL